MSKAVLISIRPKWCEKIANGEKTVEVRKTRPKLETPFKCYIYMTSGDASIPDGRGMVHHHSGGQCVIGEFVCDRFFPYCQAKPIESAADIEQQSCLTRKEIWEYDPNGNPVGWHISGLRIYDKPKALSEFIKPCENDLYCEICAMYSEFQDKCGNKALTLSRPPQSWCYVEELPEGGGE